MQLRWMLLLGLVSGCRRDPPGPDASIEPATSAAALSSAAPSSSSAPPPTASAAPPASAPAPGPPSPEQYAAYLAGLAAGRKATLAKRWTAAISAFDGALAAKPGDLRALAERGYARLVSGDPTNALVDLDAALDGPAEPKLRAQIHYNRGLAYEKLDERVRARQAFAASIAHNPTDAAKARLEKLTQADPEKKNCFVDLESEQKAGLIFPDFRAAYAVVVGKPAASESEAKAWFRVTPEEPVEVITTMDEVIAVVLRDKGDVMVLRNVTPRLMNGFKCPQFARVAGTIQHGFLHLVAEEDLCETIPHEGGFINWTGNIKGSKRTDHVFDVASALHVVSIVRTRFDFFQIDEDSVDVGMDACSTTFPRPKS